ncbi:MAG: ribose-5-phosphate isomerase RpiA [Halodesulfurarchaeum sp.]|nr:ribose-5-phosphate isomerase RpiA [Halodesulfurarchaeum sp.]
MSDGGTNAGRKRLAGERAAAMVEDGDVVGLGTGSTAACAIEALGTAVSEGLDVRGIPTSYQSRALALDTGIPLTALDAVDGVDVAIDGADEVADGNLIKGGGAAHAREKIVDAAADRFVVVVDDTKEVETLAHPVPVEVVPNALPPVREAVADLGGEPTLRSAGQKDGPVITQHGNFVLDCDFGELEDPAGLATELSTLPGVLEHGLFVGLADEIVVGGPDGVQVRSVR